MGMIEAGLPTMPAAGVSMGPNQVAAVPQGSVTGGAVQGVAIKSDAAGERSGMLTTPPGAGISQPPRRKENNAQAPLPALALPTLTAVAATIPMGQPSLSRLDAVPVKSQPSTPPAVTPDAVSSGATILTPLTVATLGAPTAKRSLAHPDLSVD